MTNKDVQTLVQGLNQVSHFVGPRFCSAVSKNKIRIKRYVGEVAKEMDKVCSTKDYRALDVKINKLRIPLCERMAKKDDSGNPIMIPNPGMQGQMVYDIPNMAKFHEEGKKLYGDLEDKKREIDIKKSEVMKEWGEHESTLELYMISEDILPEDINSTQIEGIQWMIREFLAELTSPLDRVSEEKKLPTPVKKLTKN